MFHFLSFFPNVFLVVAQWCYQVLHLIQLELESALYHQNCCIKWNGSGKPLKSIWEAMKPRGDVEKMIYNTLWFFYILTLPGCGNGIHANIKESYAKAYCKVVTVHCTICLHCGL